MSKYCFPQNIFLTLIVKLKMRDLRLVLDVNLLSVGLRSSLVTTKPKAVRVFEEKVISV